MRIKDVILEPIITHMLQICKRKLTLDELPEIIMVNEPTVEGNYSFGVFDGAIKVVAKDRHPLDICRTLAHELVHHKQRMSGMKLDGTTGSATENEANALAGIIMREFGQMYPEYFINTLP